MTTRTTEATKTIRIAWGSGGHTGEYTVNFPKTDEYTYPDEWRYIRTLVENTVAKHIPGFRVDNRGSRLELVNRRGYGISDHETVIAGFKAAFPDAVIDFSDHAPKEAATWADNSCTRVWFNGGVYETGELILAHCLVNKTDLPKDEILDRVSERAYQVAKLWNGFVS